MTLTFQVLESAEPPLKEPDAEYSTVHLYFASSALRDMLDLIIVFIFHRPSMVVAPLTSFMTSLNHYKR